MENFETKINNFHKNDSTVFLKSAEGKDKAICLICQVLSTEYRFSVLSGTETGTVPTYRQTDCNALVRGTPKVEIRAG